MCGVVSVILINGEHLLPKLITNPFVYGYLKAAVQWSLRDALLSNVLFAYRA